MSKLSVKSMDTLIVLSCYQAKGASSFASLMAGRMNTNFLIATDGQAKTWRPLWLGAFQFRSSKDPYGWKVYQKHYPTSDHDVMVRSAPQVTVREMGGHFAGVNALMKAAGVPKPK